MDKTLPHTAYSSGLSFQLSTNFFKGLNNFLQEKVLNNQEAAQKPLKLIRSRTPDFYASRINSLVYGWLVGWLGGWSFFHGM